MERRNSSRPAKLLINNQQQYHQNQQENIPKFYQQISSHLDFTNQSIQLKNKINKDNVLNTRTQVLRLQSANIYKRETPMQEVCQKKKLQQQPLNIRNRGGGTIRNEKAKLQIEYNSGKQITVPKIQVKIEDQIKKDIETYLSDPSILSTYQILSHIGKGSFSIVSLAIQKSTKKRFAVKIYEKIGLNQPHRLLNIKRQIKNLKCLNHKNIMNLVHAVVQKKKIYLLMQYGGRHSLQGILRKKQDKKLPENEAKKYFHQILSAVSCCHKQNITHRDIKLQNILVSQNNQTKLIDFGFSAMSKDKLTTFCGTPSYMSPQIIAKTSYEGQFVDIWACGIVLYVLLCGTYPFNGMNQKQLFRNIRSGKYQFKQNINISSSAKCIISKMLKVIPNHRSTAQELLSDKWFEE